MDVPALLKKLNSEAPLRGQMVHVHRWAPAEAVHAAPSRPLPEELSRALRRGGIRTLFRHQSRCVDLLRAGRDVVVATGTASGKTLCYNLPVVEALMSDPAARALYLFPTKALAQDQLRSLEALAASEESVGEAVRPGTYDGDTPPAVRRRIRAQSNLLLTNPDMLHVSILPNHGRWSDFLGGLRYVVLDEVHTYRGVFGSHVANVMRRLLRLCSHYGAAPVFICCSATIGNPAELVERLTTRSAELVDEDGAPKGTRYFVIWDTPRDSDGRHRSVNVEAQSLLCRLLRQGVQTLVFTQSRAGTELISRYVREELQETSPELVKRLGSYRGGYRPKERRDIESRLFSGELLGVVATSALELGIDVGSVDAAILVAFPGSIARTFQRAGRAGRGSGGGVVFLVASGSPIDQYIVHHPEFLLESAPEHAVVDPENPYLLSSHLACASFELPLRDADEELFGPYTLSVAEAMHDARRLKRIRDSYFWSSPDFPASRVGLRTASDEPLTIYRRGAGKEEVVGEVDALSAIFQLYPGAAYMHGSEEYVVRELNLDQHAVLVEPAQLSYYTTPDVKGDLSILGTERSRPLGNGLVCEGTLEVRQRVVGYHRRAFYTGESLGAFELELPEQTLTTAGMWIVPPAEAMARLAADGLEAAVGLSGFRNLLLAVLPVVVMCDRRDVESICSPAPLGVSTLYVYDTVPGGAGFSSKAYELFDRLLLTALQMVRECPCTDGCPSCVGPGDDRFGSGAGQPPAGKATTTALLESLLV